VLQEAPDGSHFAPAGAGDAGTASGLVIYRFGAPLYFANATLFLDEIEQIVERAPTPVRCSCWTPRRWSTSTPRARASCGRRSRCWPLARHLRRQPRRSGLPLMVGAV